MKFSSDIGPQILPGTFGPETQPKPKGEDFGGPQILPGSFGPSSKVEDFSRPQINGGPNVAGSVYTRPGQYGPVTRVALPARRGFFPAATGISGEPSVRQVDAYQGGPGGSMNAFGVRRSWTWF